MDKRSYLGSILHLFLSVKNGGTFPPEALFPGSTDSAPWLLER